MRVRALSAVSKRIAWAIHILVAAMLLFSVGTLNGRPAFFGDTPFYYSQGEFLATALGYPPLPMNQTRRADRDSVIPGSVGFNTGHAAIIAGARSPAYGLFLFLCERLGGLWLLTWAQCWIAAWIIALITRVMSLKAPLRLYWSAVAILAFGSSLPFYTAFAMPDVFAGFNVLCLVLLLIYQQSLSRSEKAGVWALITFGMAGHTANILTALGVVCAVFALTAIRCRPSRPLLQTGLGLVVAVVVAVAFLIGDGALYQRHTGVRQSAPPFLMARVLEDGPGRAYLTAHCPGGASPTLCTLRSHPMTSAEDFLWSWEPNKGAAMLIDPGVVRQLKREEPAFVLHALMERPAPEVRAAAAGWAEQLMLFSTIEPLHNPAEFLIFPWWSNTSLWSVLPGREQCEREPKGCQPRFSTLLINGVDELVLITLFAAVTFSVLSSDSRRSIATLNPQRVAQIRSARRALLLVGLAILVNAAVCAILSGPFPRYEARLIWTVPLIAWLFIAALPWRKTASP